jgi:uncharacterized protein
VKAISFPFRLNPNGLVAQTNNYSEVVRCQVIDALMTNQGERVFRPRYGCDLQAALFDPSDELVRNDAAQMVKQRLENFAPRCYVRDIKISVGGAGTIFVDILYRPTLYATDTTIQVPVSSEFLARQSRLELAP